MDKLGLVRELGPREYKKLVLLKSSVEEVEDIRRWGVFLCQAYKKKALLPTPLGIKWFWRTMEYVEDGDFVAKQFLEGKPELKNYYQFDKLNWTRAFKDFLIGDDDLLKKKLEGTGIMDYVLFFSLLWPFPDTGTITFWNFTNAVYAIKKPEHKIQIADYIIAKDRETLQKLLKGEIVPWFYTRYLAYPTLRNLVLKRLLVNKEIGPLLKQAAKLTDKGVDVIFEEAAVGPKT